MAEHPDVVAAFHRASRKTKAPRVIRKALFASGIVETNLTDLNYGDRDSEGALQQRPSQGWGPASETAEQDAVQFIQRAKAILRNNPGISSAALAQAVQRSAFPGRYGAPNVQQRAARLSAGGSVGGPAAGPTTVTGPSRTSVTLGQRTIPGQDFSQEREAAKAQLLMGGALTVKRLLDYKRTVNSLQDVPERTVPGDLRVKTARGRSTTVRPGTAPSGKAHISITGANPERLKPSVTRFMRQLSQATGQPISGDSGAGHSRLTVNGNVSQHSTGDAVDIPATGRRLILLGQAALVLAGMPRAKARKQRGGLYNVNGRQIIFNTHEGGDHTNHLHFGD